MIVNEYKRIYENFDKCLKAFEQIMLVCTEQNNHAIGKIISETLDNLEKPYKLDITVEQD